MRILIAGSRKYPNLDLVRKFVDTLPDDTILLNGRAIGVDNVARNQALFKGLIVQDFEPEYLKFGYRAPIYRNHVMVDIAEWVICFWDGESHGTQDVIDYSLNQSKPLTVYNIYGQKEEFNMDEKVPAYKPLEVENGWE